MSVYSHKYSYIPEIKEEKVVTISNDKLASV